MAVYCQSWDARSAPDVKRPVNYESLQGRELDLHSVEVKSALVPPPLQYHVVGRSDRLVGTGLMHLAACRSAGSKKKGGSRG